MDSRNKETKIQNEIKEEPWKTFLAGIFFLASMFATSLSLALTHDQVPIANPLPDIVSGLSEKQEWGLLASEVCIIVGALTACLSAMFHKHRVIVFRRIWFNIGIHYFYRAITMHITVLPKPDLAYQCEAQRNDTTTFDIMHRVLQLTAGFGLSLNGGHPYCGDYIYSGHTISLVLTFLIIREYSPSSSKKWMFLRVLSWCNTTLGIISLLLARGHYSVDVLVAYWITTRVWWMYHVMCKNECLKTRENPNNELARAWWWFIFIFFEGQVPAHLPRSYEIPLLPRIFPCLRKLKIEEKPEDVGKIQRRFGLGQVWTFFKRKNQETMDVQEVPKEESDFVDIKLLHVQVKE